MNDGEGTGIAGLQGATVSVADPAAEEKRRRRGPNETVILVLFFFVSLAAVGLLLWREESRLLDDPNAKAERGEIVGDRGRLAREPLNFSARWARSTSGWRAATSSTACGCRL